MINACITLACIAAAAMLALLAAAHLRSGAFIAGRLSRFAPLPMNGNAPDAWETPAWLRAVLIRLDPTFAILEQGLNSVGVSRDFVLAAVSGARLALAISIGGYLANAAGGHWGGPWIPIAAAAAGFTLTLYVTYRIVLLVVRDLRNRILGEIFFSIDLLVIFLESGQSLDQSLRSLAELGDEANPRTNAIHARLVTDLSRGVSHEKAFSAWAERLGIDHARDMAAFFLQSLVHGTELGPQLRRFADEIMERRLLNARARLGSKAAQLTVIMVLFFLPTVLLLLAGPPVVSLLRNIGSMN